ncbi:daunorubicin resistance protein DrrA family ABC transporter ATP-binding protein [Georgenia halophila]|uniref:Daunorubicin resistance protein DrrA family ABC transporter ATP-binding protein n=1 Tax=Georgenia halophila TaxID=620889 RepID=A0ABP8LPC5_9MICO
MGGYDVVRDAGTVRRLIGLTGQSATVDEDLTGRENLVLFGKLLDLPTRRARARADELIEQFGLLDAAERRLSTYSGGMRRRLDLAAGLVGDPSVVFLDEPTTGLDPRKRDDMWDTVRSLTASGVTVLLTTQYLEEADALADEIAVIDHGRVIAHDTPAGLKQTAGRQTAVVRPRDPADLGRATDVLTRVTGRRGVQPVGGQLTVPVDNDQTFTHIVQELAAARVPAVELALRLPSLDDVFLSLTGVPTEPDQERTNEPDEADELDAENADEEAVAS